MGTQKPPRQQESKQMFQCLGLKRGFVSDECAAAESVGKLPGALSSRECGFQVVFIWAPVPLPPKTAHSVLRLASRSVTTTELKIPWAGKDEICTNYL